ncbi:hypothetical protein ACFLQ2_02660 [archaeon]
MSHPFDGEAISPHVLGVMPELDYLDKDGRVSLESIHKFMPKEYIREKASWLKRLHECLEGGPLTLEEFGKKWGARSAYEANAKRNIERHLFSAIKWEDKRTKK